jgi:hypothetical protein
LNIEDCDPIMKHWIPHTLVLSALLVSGAALAKLPTPTLSDEQKAKAEEAKAKAAHGNKVEAYKLCKAIDKSAAHYYKTAAAAKKETKPPTQTPACVDPGPFVPPVASAAPAPAAAPATPAAKEPAKKS